jgi:hypothetical protein
MRRATPRIRDIGYSYRLNTQKSLAHINPGRGTADFYLVISAGEFEIQGRVEFHLGGIGECTLTLYKFKNFDFPRF